MTTVRTPIDSATSSPAEPDHVAPSPGSQQPPVPASEHPRCTIHLQDGTAITGQAFGADRNVAGELVFFTGMVGYPESLTDPSYRGQILVLTYPLIGNYGVPSDDERDELGLLRYMESEEVQIAGLIVSDYTEQYSHYEARQSLGAWLKKHNVPAVFGVDTRALTKKMRSEGSMLAKLICDGPPDSLPFTDPNARNLVAEVSRKHPVTYGKGPIKIVAVDCGMKNNIVRYFVRNCNVTLKVVPWNWDLEQERAPGGGEQPMDGLFVSNGPGDPSMVQETVRNLKKFVCQQQDDSKLIPVFGICLGNQLMGLAAGCQTYKMKFGNRGMNVPVIDMRTTLAYITSQNHGYAIDNDTLPADWKCFFLNANDSSNEGLIHAHAPFFSVQFHPEHKGGPTDTEWLFHMFIDRVRDRRTMITTVRWQPTCGEVVRRVLILGSGGLSIGQAGEFDYSGCLHPATPVQLSSGVTTPAKALQPGMMLKGLQGPVEVLEVTPGKSGRMFTVRLESGFEYTVTDMHRVTLKWTRGVEFLAMEEGMMASMYVRDTTGRIGKVTKYFRSDSSRSPAEAREFALHSIDASHPPLTSSMQDPALTGACRLVPGSVFEMRADELARRWEELVGGKDGRGSYVVATLSEVEVEEPAKHMPAPARKVAYMLSPSSIDPASPAFSRARTNLARVQSEVLKMDAAEHRSIVEVAPEVNLLSMLECDATTIVAFGEANRARWVALQKEPSITDFHLSSSFHGLDLLRFEYASRLFAVYFAPDPSLWDAQQEVHRALWMAHGRPLEAMERHAPLSCGGGSLPRHAARMQSMVEVDLRGERADIISVSVSGDKRYCLGSPDVSVVTHNSQAIKALKEESKHVILINPNIATVQTSYGMANQVYFLPLTLEFVTEVIAKERPDGILLQFGGQTALQCGMQLEKSGVLAKYGVRVLGTQVSVIESTEDREIFAQKLDEIGEVCAPSKTVYTVEAALDAAKHIGYPVLVRAGFALGGLGSGFAHDESELELLVRKSFNYSSQIIIDKSLVGWKEVEYEVVRDAKDNCIVVCNMENFDPLGIHTGDSIVVAPSQTLSNDEFYMLRRVAIKVQVIRHLGVVGECFTDDHELLTEAGWRNIDELRALKEPPVAATYNSVTHELEYRPVTRLFIKHSTEGSPHRVVEMTTADGKYNHISLAVTREHAVYRRTGYLEKGVDGQQQRWDTGDYTTAPAESLLVADKSRSFKLLSAASGGIHPSNTEEPLPFAEALHLTTDDQVDAFLSLYGYLLGDSVVTLEFNSVTFSTAAGQAWLANLLARLPIQSHHILRGEQQWRITDPVWVRHFAEEQLAGDEKRFASWVFDRLDARQLRSILRGLSLADGDDSTRGHEDAGAIYTSSARFRDELTRVCLHAGLAVFFVRDDKTGAKGHQDACWRVEYSAEERATEPTLQATEVTERLVDGRVWCCTVPPHHLVVVRRVERDAKGVVVAAATPVIAGQCNIQYALDPHSQQYVIIEVNARLSRSSALASKATGYPLAYVAAKLSLGLSLTDVKNSVTKVTTAMFEPSMDYCVVKIPRWDMKKFQHVSASIGSAMKSVGEVMSIGRSFEETFQKALRMVDTSMDGFGDTAGSALGALTNEELNDRLAKPSDERLLALAIAFQRGGEAYTVEKIHQLTYIDRWFLHKLKRVIDQERTIQARYAGKDLQLMTDQDLLASKKLGFSDAQLARCFGSNTTALAVRLLRCSRGITPWVKQIDTLAAEFPAQTNYLYMTYHGSEHDVTFQQANGKSLAQVAVDASKITSPSHQYRQLASPRAGGSTGLTSPSAASSSSSAASSNPNVGVIVLGCGAYRIGSSCEFDWCAVSCMPSVDHRVLTDRGFLFLHEIRALLSAGEEVLYASYSRSRSCLDYKPGKLVVLDAAQRPSRLVDFTSADGRALWGSAVVPANEPLSELRRPNRGRHLSLRVTPNHNMFVQVGNCRASSGHFDFLPRVTGGFNEADRSEVPFGLMRAEELTAGYQCDCRADDSCPHGRSTVRMMGIIANGASHSGLTASDPQSPLACLKLRTEEQLDAFLQLYGYWLGDGTMSYYTAGRGGGGINSVRFCTVKDEQYLRDLIPRTGLTADKWRVTSYGNRMRHDGSIVQIADFRITCPAWFAYFDAEYGRKYNRSHEAEPMDLSEEKQGSVDQSAVGTRFPSPPSSSSDASGSAHAAVSGGDAEGKEVLELACARTSTLTYVEPNIKSVKWFWWWVLRRLNKRQMRLLIEGLRCADGHWAFTAAQLTRMMASEEEDGEYAGPRGRNRIFTSSVRFRDEIMNACLHAGYTTHATKASIGQQKWVNGDGRFYNEAQKAQLDASQAGVQWKPLVRNADPWVVLFSEQFNPLVDVVDIQYDGAPFHYQIANRNSHAGFAAVHEGSRRVVLGPSLAQIGAEIDHAGPVLGRWLAGQKSKSGWRVYTEADYNTNQRTQLRARYPGLVEKRLGATAQAAAVVQGTIFERDVPTGATAPYDPASDGELWCVELENDTDHLIVVQRALADERGIVQQVSRPVVIGNCIRTLKKLGFSSIMINYNPETVSTDYDECSRLYFEELSFEVVMDIYELENPMGVVVSVGGQIPNNLAIPLSRAGVHILGTSPSDIDTAENRQKFSALMDSIGVDQPPWNELRSMEDAKMFAAKVGYPVLVRPSYVLSGAAMNVAQNDSQLVSYLSQAAQLNEDHPVVISKFITHAKEIEYDGVASAGSIVNFAISEHIENAGVHSGDATLLLPAQKLYTETIKRIKKISAKIARALNITGPFNIQYLSRNNDIKVIECNLRASRSVPFVSKTFNVNFIDLATKIMVGSPVKASRIELLDIDHVVVKVPMFSFTRLQGADPVLRVEMASTGEVACFSSRPLEAFLKGLLATGGFKLPRKLKTILLSIGPHDAKVEFLTSVQKLLQMGYTLYGTAGTAAFYSKYGLLVTPLDKPEHLKRAVARRRSSVGMTDNAEERARLAFAELEEAEGARKMSQQQSEQRSPSRGSGVLVESTSSTPVVLTPRDASNGSTGTRAEAQQLPNLLEVLKTGSIELVINVPNVADPLDLSAGYHLRRTAIDFSVPLVSNMKNAIMLTEGLEMMAEPGFQWEIKSWESYLRAAKIEA